MDLDLFKVFDRESGAAPPEAGLPLAAADADGQATKRRRVRTAEAVDASVEDGDKVKVGGGVNSTVSGGVSMDTSAGPVPASAPSEPRPPAKVYKYKLDVFQEEAIACIEREESVLVAAHTSAGKTTVAEYAIAKSLRDKQRVIYTSPIKALSNQKFRDLKDEFGDVGLMTGDMTVNPDASCIIMTTEILRSMLYRGSEMIREVAWVIYDEVHYMRDKERGVVWEESIILLPHNVKYVFLSATIPNAKDFTNWVEKIHHQPCHVVYTNYRPTPLMHFLCPDTDDESKMGMYLIVDAKSNFKEENFQKAMGSLMPTATEELEKKKTQKATKKTHSDLFKIIRVIMDKDLCPCIIFSFSKKDCETYAVQMSRLDFNTEEEKQLIEQVFVNAMEALPEEDQTLPAIVSILPMLKRGIGIHHGGLMPILREIIEILFQEGLIKCLFATETFSIGINMPAKSVVFTNTRKFDGKDYRFITSGEYIQMSGRAGRRGKDPFGTVIQMVNEKMEPDVLKNMVYGASDPLHSSYHVSYNMLLNLLRLEGADPEKILKCSFYQFEREKDVPQLIKDADALQAEAQTLVIQNESLISDYYNLIKLSNSLHEELSEIIMRPQFSLPFIQAGRLVSIRKSHYPSKISVDENVWGVVTSIRKNENKEAVLGSSDVVADHYVDLLIALSGSDSHEIATFPLNKLSQISAVKLNLPKDITKDTVKKSVGRALGEVQRRFAESGLPLLDAVNDIGIDVSVYNDYTERQKDIALRLTQSEAINLPDCAEMLLVYDAKCKLLEQSRQKMALSVESQNVVMKDEVRRMKRVLRRLGYVSDDGVLSAKGRFACELTLGDEIVLTDMVFDGAFNDLAVEQIVGILSCFVSEEGRDDDKNSKIKPEMQAAVRTLHSAVRNYVKVCVDAKMTMDEQETVDRFKTSMIDIVYAWCLGAKFSEIVKLTDIYEGSIIRAIRRLDELLRQLAAACTTIGNHELKTKFNDASTKIRRGVCFVCSLYN